MISQVLDLRVNYSRRHPLWYILYEPFGISQAQSTNGQIDLITVLGKLYLMKKLLFEFLAPSHGFTLLEFSIFLLVYASLQGISTFIL